MIKRQATRISIVLVQILQIKNTKKKNPSYIWMYQKHY